MEFGPAVGLLLEGIVRPNVRGDVGDMDPEAEAAVGPLGRDRVVEVVRAGRIDGEGGEIPEVAADRGPGLRPLGRLRRLLLDSARESDADLRSSSIAAITSAARPGSRAPGPPSPVRGPGRARPAPSAPGSRPGARRRARFARRARREARRRGTGLASRRGLRASRAGAGLRAAGPAPGAPAARPSSGFVLGLSFAFTCGGIPMPLIDVPLRVRYSPTVRSSAPPLFRGITSWNVPLPKRLSRPPSRCRTAQRGRDDLRGGRGVAVDQDDHRMARQRIAGRLEGPGVRRATVGRDDDAVGDEDAGDKHPLRRQAPPVAPRSSMRPWVPCGRGAPPPCELPRVRREEPVQPN